MSDKKRFPHEKMGLPAGETMEDVPLNDVLLVMAYKMMDLDLRVKELEAKLAEEKK